MECYVSMTNTSHQIGQTDLQFAVRMTNITLIGLPIVSLFDFNFQVEVCPGFDYKCVVQNFDQYFLVEWVVKI